VFGIEPVWYDIFTVHWIHNWFAPAQE